MSTKNNITCSSICPCASPCPIGTALGMIGGRWKMRILCSLFADGSLRYRDLQEKIRGISPAMLSSSLREMEHDGLLTRAQFEEVPVRVEYSLTDRCKELRPILHALAHWALNEPLEDENE